MSIASNTTSSQPLLVYFDLETTGLGDYRKIGIIEIGAKVHGHAEETFSCLVRTTTAIQADASFIHGLYNQDLDKEEPFPVVFRSFVTWLEQATDRCSSADDISYYPVLVAHNGFNYDYMVLLSEIQSHDVDPSCLDEVMFADSLHHLRELREHEVPLVQGISLGLKSLSTHFFAEEKYIGHRALADAENLEQLFTKTDLVHHLPFTPRSYKDLLGDWKRSASIKGNQGQ